LQQASHQLFKQQSLQMHNYGYRLKTHKSNLLATNNVQGDVQIIKIIEV